MDIEYMKEYLVMVEESNYTEAADKLYLSQSTLFKHIKTLENELGVPLFEKSGRRITITEYGRVFADYAGQIVGLSNRCVSDIQKLQDKESNLIVLSALYRTHDLVRDFCYMNKGYMVRTKPGDAYKLLASGECNLAMMLCGLETKEEKSQLREFEHIDVAKESMAAFVPLNHPLAARRSVSIEELAGEDIIAINSDNDLGMRIFKMHGIDPKVVVSTNVGTEAIELVEDNGGIAILHKKNMAMKYPDAQFAIVDLEPEVELSITVCWRKDQKLSKAEKKFIGFLKEYYKDY